MKNQYVIAALVTGGFALAMSIRAADPPQGPPTPAPSGQANSSQHGQCAQMPTQANMAPGHCYLSASYIIGREVRNDVGERLGAVKDLIVCLDSHTAPFAILKCGGTLGIGETRVAVPCKDLKWSADMKEFIMAATKDQIQSASPTPLGEWAFAAKEGWAGKVNRFYGNPGKLEVSQLEPSMSEPGQSGDREFVRESAQPDPEVEQEYQPPASGAQAGMLSAEPADRELLARVTRLVEQDAGPAASVYVRVAGEKGAVGIKVAKGVVTLSGSIATDAERQDLETRIRAFSGVMTLHDDQLIATKE